MDNETILRLLSSSEPSENKTQLMSLISKLSSYEENSQLVDINEHISDLKRLYSNLEKKYTFNIGDIVRWKEGLKNKRVPQDKLPAIVVDVLEKPIYDEKVEMGSPYFREPLDIVLGVINKGELITFYYDSRRFELFDKNKLNSPQ